MKKKGLISMLVAVTLVAVIGVGATLAYFTDKEVATNVITMGHVDIDLIEPLFPEDKKVENITPGQVIEKDPTIVVDENSEDAYVRATVSIEGLTVAQEKDIIDGIEIMDGWYLAEDGYYYYNQMLTAEEKVTLFEKVVIPEKWGNEVADLTFKINVTAEAIQADNFEPTYDETETYIIAWTYRDKTPVTAETYEAKSAVTESSEAPEVTE